MNKEEIEAMIAKVNAIRDELSEKIDPHGGLVGPMNHLQEAVYGLQDLM